MMLIRIWLLQGKMRGSLPRGVHVSMLTGGASVDALLEGSVARLSCIGGVKEALGVVGLTTEKMVRWVQPGMMWPGILHLPENMPDTYYLEQTAMVFVVWSVWWC